MKVIIDRFDGIYAVCEKEDKTIINIEVSRCPKNIKEGDILIIQSDKIKLDNESTETRKKYIEKLTEDLWEN